MMKRRTKLRESLLHSHSQQTLNKLMAIEEAIITSHINELSHEEAIAVAKIKLNSLIVHSRYHYPIKL